MAYTKLKKNKIDKIYTAYIKDLDTNVTHDPQTLTDTFFKKIQAEIDQAKSVETFPKELLPKILAVKNEESKEHDE